MFHITSLSLNDSVIQVCFPQLTYKITKHLQQSVSQQHVILFLQQNQQVDTDESQVTQIISMLLHKLLQQNSTN